MATKFISDVLSASDILAHESVLLVSGVGAGKNTFFETQFPDQQVLIVTSRAAKVEQGRADLASKGITNVHYQTYSAFAINWEK